MDFLDSIKDIFFKFKNYFIIGGILLLILLSMVGFYYCFDKKIKNLEDSLAFDFNESKVLEMDDNDKKEVYYKVEVKGSVHNPGVYELVEGSRVIDAINAAGGLLDNADTSVNNLGKLVKDEMVIIVYTKDEVNNFTKVLEEEKVVEEKCLDNNGLIENNSCVCESEKESSDSVDSQNDNKVQDKISINKASKEELMTLSGIGEAKALKIIEYRNTNGYFKSIDEIMNVSGIGDAVFEKIKDFITVD